MAASGVLMRILQIVQKPQRRGAEMFAFQLSGELRRQGHEVGIVYLYPHDGPGALALGADDVCLEGDERSPLERLCGAHPGLLAKLRRRIADFAPDVVQVNGARSVKYGALARRLGGRRLGAGLGWALLYRNIGNPRDWMRGRLKRAFYDHLVMPALDGIVGVSRTTLDAVLELYGLEIPAENIPRAVDPESLAPRRSRAETRRMAGTPEGAPVVVAVGSLAPEKRIDRLLRVAAKSRESIAELRLWLVGEGSLRGELEELAEELGLGGRVHFAGVRDDVGDWLHAADLLALTSDTEGIPGAVLEAGCAGLAVVAARVGGVAECVVDGETGVLVAREDEDAFAAAIAALLGDDARRRALGERAAAHVREHFALDRIAARYVELYARLVAARRGGGESAHG